MFLLWFLLQGMASLWKHPKSPFFTACFTDKHGRRLKRSTKTADRKKAFKIAEQYEEAAQNKRTARQVREVIQGLHEMITGEGIQNLSFKAHVVNWLGEKEGTTAPSTHAHYTASTQKFIEFLGVKAEGNIADLSRADITGYRTSLAKAISARTVNHDLKCLRMVFKAANRDGLIAEDPTEFVAALKLGRSNPRKTFTIEEVGAVLAIAGDEWRSMILFGLYTGQRLSDIASLTWADISLDKGEIQLTTAKTSKRLLIPMAAPLIRYLKGLYSPAHQNEPMHPVACSVLKRNGRSALLSNQFIDLLAQAGLRTKVSHSKKKEGRATARDTGGQLSFHSLRHTAVTMLKEAGVPSAVVMELIGHDSEQMSQHYTHVGREALDKAAATLPDLVCPNGG